MGWVVLRWSAGAPALTALQWEIVRLVEDGRTNAEIAARLGMTPGTVGTHVGRIVERLGLDGRADIAPWAGAWWRGGPGRGHSWAVAGAPREAGHAARDGEGAG